MLPQQIKELAAILSNLPGIGPRQAIRLAIDVAKSCSKQKELSQTLEKLSSIKLCEQCYLVHAGRAKLCGICSDKGRDQDMVAIVEKITDLLTLEQSKTYKGRYFILGALRKDGTLRDEHKQRLQELKKQFKKPASEIILALSPTSYGELNASILESELKDFAKKISRLGRGLPTGGEIEFADEQTLDAALRNRN